MQARLRLLPAFDGDPLEDHLATVMAHVLRTRGFTELQTMIARHTERLAKANVAALAAEGWIA